MLRDAALGGSDPRPETTLPHPGGRDRGDVAEDVREVPRLLRPVVEERKRRRFRGARASTGDDDSSGSSDDTEVRSLPSAAVARQTGVGETRSTRASFAGAATRLFDLPISTVVRDPKIGIDRCNWV